VINGDSNASCESGGKTGVFDFSEGEASAVSHLASISASSLGDDGTQVLSGSGEDTGRLGNSILVSLELLGRLIEVSFGSSRPVLARNRKISKTHIMTFNIPRITATPNKTSICI